jgi:hypothetical protein
MSNAISAVSAVQFSDLGAAQRWFELIGEECTPEITWDEFRSALITRGAETVGSGYAEAFVQHVEALGGDPLDTVKEIAADTGWAFNSYAAALGADPAETATVTEYEPAAWDAYLAENGPAWDGTEGQWETFTTWFVYHAGEQGLATPAQAFIDYVVAQPDRVATFAAYGVSIAAPAPGGVSEEVVELIGRAGLDDLLASDPELAALPADKLDTLLRETLAEMGEAVGG